MKDEVKQKQLEFLEIYIRLDINCLLAFLLKKIKDYKFNDDEIKKLIKEIKSTIDNNSKELFNSKE